MLSERVGIEIFHVFPEYRVVKSNGVKISKINVPKRWDITRYEEIKGRYSDVEVEWTEWKKGSGTPYALVYPEIWQGWPKIMEVFSS